MSENAKTAREMIMARAIEVVEQREQREQAAKKAEPAPAKKGSELLKARTKALREQRAAEQAEQADLRAKAVAVAEPVAEPAPAPVPVPVPAPVPAPAPVPVAEPVVDVFAERKNTNSAEMNLYLRRAELRAELEQIEEEYEELVNEIRLSTKNKPSDQMIAAAKEQLEHWSKDEFPKGIQKIVIQELSKMVFDGKTELDLDPEFIVAVMSDHGMGDTPATMTDVYSAMYDAFGNSPELPEWLSPSQSEKLKNWLSIRAGLNNGADDVRGPAARKDASARGVLWDQITTASGRVIPVSPTKAGGWTVRGRGAAEAIKQGKTTPQEIADLIAKLDPPRKE